MTCDDCYRDYPGPVYYTFDPDACISTRDAVQMGERRPLTEDPDEEIVHGDDCTGNLCPSCAGPYLEPDDPNDPRRPKEALSMNDLTEPRCDICGRTQNDSPNVFDYGDATEADWNGETGNHALCETEAASRPRPGHVRIIALDMVGGEAREDIGTFGSVQVTGREVRDDDDHTLLVFRDEDERWVSLATGDDWYDFTIESA